MQQVVNVFKNGVDFTNLNQQVFTFTVSVDSNGKPVQAVQLKSVLTTKVIGLICINAVNQSNLTRVLSTSPFISFTLNGNFIQINNISGITIPAGQTNSDTYELTILSIGANIPTA